jgi:hypothetical protein
VQLASLGSLLYEVNAQLRILPMMGQLRRFSNGISVCYAFWQFFDAYEGSVISVSPFRASEVRWPLYPAF